MKPMKTLLTLSILALISAPALAQDMRKPVDYRRTLFAPVGQETLKLEAPEGMCFFDSTQRAEGAILAEQTRIFAKHFGGVLVGMFAPCHDIANFGAAGALDTVGTVAWLNPRVGEKTPLERLDYLDLRGASYRADSAAMMEKAKAALQGGKTIDDTGSKIVDEIDFEDEAQRTDHVVSLGYITLRSENGEKRSDNRIIGTTTVRHVPLEIMMSFNSSAEAPSLQELHGLIDTFAAQQIALNE